MMNQDKNENLEILLTEYRTLKDEEKSIFSFQFTIIGVWLTFLGVMINSLFNQVKEIQTYVYSNYDIYSENINEILSNYDIMPGSRDIMALLISILIPGTCALFGLLWLDLTTRFVKEAHYIFIIEHKIKANYPYSIGFDHYLYKETKDKRGLNKTNYVYYFLMLGVMILCPFLVICFNHYLGYLYNLTWIHKVAFIIIEVFTFFVSRLYVKRILSYANEKDAVYCRKVE
ncbi:MAG: hypothetical protein ACLSBG_03775 [Sellimonas intestinalis]|jgi:hypothetical protein|uniref:hypothetical protein n=2 Tax=Sellimonas intestinalis TaxID=1653434 RepID=UPI00189BEA7B|nr:hypothetical protein [Sellimonas intestinalis]